MPIPRTSVVSPWARFRRWSILAAVWLVLWTAGSFVMGCVATRRFLPPHPEPLPAEWTDAELVFIETEDRERLGGWFRPGRRNGPPVLFMHGFYGNRSQCIPEAEIAQAMGCPTLLISARAHGDSTGTTLDVGYSSRFDVAAGVAWLEKRCPGKRPVVWGGSMGAAAAIFASEALGSRVQGYILECPYRDLRTALWNRCREGLPFGLSHLTYGAMTAAGSMMLPNVDAICPARAAAGMPAGAKVLIFAGEHDYLSPPEESAAIRNALRGPAELILLPNARHGNFHLANPEILFPAVQKFLADCSG